MSGWRGFAFFCFFVFLVVNLFLLTTSILVLGFLSLFRALKAMLLSDFCTVKDEGLLRKLLVVKRLQFLFILALRV